MSESHHSGSMRTRYDVLDGMRGIAAITVMVAHYLPNSDLTIENIKFVTLNNAGLAVDFFFILSGFVITHSYGRRLLNGMSVWEYLCKRIIRLYPMFFVGLLIGVPAMIYFMKTGVSTYSNRSVVGSFVYNSAFIPFLSSSMIRFIGGKGAIVGEIFPANPPAWSLFFEMVASIAFVALLKYDRKILLRSTVACYAMLVVGGLISSFSDYAPFYLHLASGPTMDTFIGGFPRVFYGFTCGILIYQIARDDQCSRVFRDVVARLIRSSYSLYFVLVAVFLFPSEVMGLYTCFILAVVAPCLVLVGSTTRCTQQAGVLLARFLGWISYPVYCLHYPVGRAVFSFGDRVAVPREVLVLVSIAVTFIASIVIVKFLEEPVRRYLSGRLAKHAYFLERNKQVPSAQKAGEPVNL
ncbi:acyltransferase family protein [Fundidesulfovibrio terrae]|uniref:acyltransferase family protein n=1 Tax=Fundidesulfovibrio terrae TaxID=2922866 RepID=UPI001FAFE977|nr:acyltransferase [Fundidesulfovibrio terrae]